MYCSTANFACACAKVYPSTTGLKGADCLLLVAQSFCHVSVKPVLLFVKKENMPLTPNELAELAVTFPEEHAEQIIAKSAKYGLPREDISQDVSCLVSCDHVPRRSMALFRAKAVLDEIIAGFPHRSSAPRRTSPYRA